MIFCKWCRMQIVPVSNYDGGIPGWQHWSGMVTCPHHPEAFAEPADGRWESVWASIEPMGDEFFPDGVVFRVSLVRGGNTIHLNLQTTKTELKLASFNLYAKILDSMVKELDDILAWS